MEADLVADLADALRFWANDWEAVRRTEAADVMRRAADEIERIFAELGVMKVERTFQELEAEDKG